MTGFHGNELTIKALKRQSALSRSREDVCHADPVGFAECQYTFVKSPVMELAQGYSIFDDIWPVKCPPLNVRRVYTRRQPVYQAMKATKRTTVSVVVEDASNKSRIPRSARRDGEIGQTNRMSQVSVERLWPPLIQNESNDAFSSRARVSEKLKQLWR